MGRRAWRCAVAGALVLGVSACVPGVRPAAEAAPEAVVDAVVGDTLPVPLAPAGDPARGRALLVARDNANCVVCHAIPDPALPFAGNVGPSLAGVGARLGVAALRLRVVDNARVNPETLMPSYYRRTGFDRVAQAYRGRTILSAQEVEDVVAFLATLR